MFRGIVYFVYIFRNIINIRIGALSGKNNCHQQFVGIAVRQFGFSDGELFIEPGKGSLISVCQLHAAKITDSSVDAVRQ